MEQEIEQEKTEQTELKIPVFLILCFLCFLLFDFLRPVTIRLNANP